MRSNGISASGKNVHSIQVFAGRKNWRGFQGNHVLWKVQNNGPKLDLLCIKRVNNYNGTLRRDILNSTNLLPNLFIGHHTLYTLTVLATEIEKKEKKNQLSVKFNHKIVPLTTNLPTKHVLFPRLCKIKREKTKNQSQKRRPERCYFFLVSISSDLDHLFRLYTFHSHSLSGLSLVLSAKLFWRDGLVFLYKVGLRNGICSNPFSIWKSSRHSDN